MKQVFAAFLLTLAATTASAAELSIFPDEIELSGKRDFQSFVVQLTEDDGTTRDVTDSVDASIQGDAAVALEGSIARPVADGDARLVVSYRDLEATSATSVQYADVDPPLSFRLDVMPVLMKGGCNAGRCHGAARGKDGFHLSLFGYDADGDYFRLTREMSGRRLNLARPEASLLLTKATGSAPHTGGERFAAESEHYQTLLRWIREGAADDADDVAEPIGIEISPPESILVGPDLRQQLTVRAKYSDGTDRDVTRLAVFLSNNDNSAEVSDEGLIVSGARGEAFVMARFATFTEGVRVIVLPADGGPEFTEPKPVGEIDALVWEKLRKLQIQPSDPCTDEEFLRRICLDLTGLTPTYEQYESFVGDSSSDKRAALIDQLLDSDAFVDVWAMRLGEMLRIRTDNQVSYKALVGFHNWVRDQLLAEQPLDQLFADVLRATGGTFDAPATNFFQIEANTLQIAENVAQTYMGVRVQCAQCHNHPFDRWTMDDYYGFAAFFSQVGFKQSHDPREFIVYDASQGEVRHVVTGEAAEPKFLGGDAADVTARSRREALADWITSPENPQFARNLSNVIWAHHFGRGVVDPVDDVRISNPPSNPELLEVLGRRLADSGFQLKSLVREICNSQTYQRSTRPNDSNRDDLTNFSRGQVRRIRAEAMLDSISRITETEDRFPRLPAGARAAQIADGAVSNYFLSTFGRAPRETVCSCEVDVEPNLSQAFHLLNGDTTNNKIVEGGVVRRMLDAGRSSAEVIEHLYISCYSRRPSESELSELLAALDQDDPATALEDVFWALLNSKEFIFNH